MADTHIAPLQTHHVANDLITAPLEATTVVGVLKWFNHVSGFGFVADSSGGSDAILRLDVLTACGINVLREGDAICCDVVPSPYGRRVVRIRSIEPLAPTRATDRAGQQRAGNRKRPEIIGDWVPATVKSFDTVRGFGFFRVQDDTRDVFVHKEALAESGIVSCIRYQTFDIRYGETSTGLVAVEIRRRDV